MGFDERSNQMKVFCSIKKGEVIHKNPAGEYETHGGVTGILTDIFVKTDGKYGPELHLSLFDKNVYVLQMKLDSGYGRAFLKIIPNADLAIPMSIVPTYRPPKDGQEFGESGMIITQGGKALKWAYTKDNPNGLPPLEQLTVKGKKVWDNTKQIEFLLNVALNQIKPMLQPLHVLTRGNPNSFAPQEANGGSCDATASQNFTDYCAPATSDDLPF